MTRLAIWTGVLTLSLAWSIAANPSSTSSTASTPDKLIEEIYLDLAEMKGLAVAIPNKSIRQSMDSAIRRAEGKLNLLKQMQQPSDPPLVSKPLISQSDFDALVKEVKKSSFYDDKEATLKIALSAASITSEQAGKLIDLFSFSSEQVKIAVMLYSHTSDKHNFYKALNIMKFESDRASVRKQLNL